MPKTLPALLAVVAAALTLGVTPAAAGSTPCWQLLLNDYFKDGRVDHTYQLKCYSQAVAHLDVDQQIYGSAANDLKRARNLAIFNYQRKHHDRNGRALLVGPETPLPPPGGGHHPESFFTRLANAIGPGNATSIPLPLLILAGVGLLLVLGALTSYAARRIQARRMRPQPATSPPTPRRR
jgi:hypothetical protein